MKNYAIVLPERHKSEVIEVPMPEVKDNEVLVSTNISMIFTGTEMTGYTGEFPADRYEWCPPFTFGLG